MVSPSTPTVRASSAAWSRMTVRVAAPFLMRYAIPYERPFVLSSQVLRPQGVLGQLVERHRLGPRQLLVREQDRHRAVVAAHDAEDDRLEQRPDTRMVEDLL